MTTTTAATETRTLEVPGATLTYDVRTSPGTTEPPLFLLGSPMAAAGFGTLASHFPDRTILTYDPRGSERSVLADPTGRIDPEIHADDIHAVIEAVGRGSVDVFASSGGAINALALVARHPDDVHTLVAHEPPLATVVPDRVFALAAQRAVHETYMQHGWGAGMAHFIAVVSHQGPYTAEVVAQPAPDPAMFGMPTGDDGSRSDPLLGAPMLTIPTYEPDFEALKAAPTRIVMAAGVESEGALTSRATYGVAERLGGEPVIFPSGHAGFLGGEYGQTGEPEAFAAKLREVLEG